MSQHTTTQCWIWKLFFHPGRWWKARWKTKESSFRLQHFSSCQKLSHQTLGRRCRTADRATFMLSHTQKWDTGESKHSCKNKRSWRCKACLFSKRLHSRAAFLNPWVLWRQFLESLRRQNSSCCQWLTELNLPSSHSLHLTELAVYRREKNIYIISEVPQGLTEDNCQIQKLCSPLIDD